jgi:hypothetical protein
MSRSRRPIAALAALATLALACGGGPPMLSPVTITLLPGSPPPAGTPTPLEISPSDPIVTLPPTESLGPATAEIELDITGGPAAGSYRAVINGTSCIRQSEDEFGANYADASAADGFTALNLTISDTSAAIQDETDDFSLGLEVGDITLTINPKAGQGEGTVLLEIDPLANGTLDLTATAEDGSEIELSLLCKVESF